MVATEIIINAPPSKVREVFLDFRSLQSYHSLHFHKITAKSQDQQTSLQAGNQLALTIRGMSFDATIQTNSAEEFSWYKKVGAHAIVNATHKFKFLPGEMQNTTRFVQEEEFGGVVGGPLFRMMDSGSMSEGFTQFNRDLKCYVEEGHS